MGWEAYALIAGANLLANWLAGQGAQQAQRNIAEEGLAQQQRLANVNFAQNMMQQGQSLREKSLDQMMNQFRSMI